MSNKKKIVRKVLDKVRADNRTALTAPEAKQVCDAYDIPVPKEGLATSAKEAAKLAKKTGFPVVLKIVSPDILHKTEAGGVIVGLNKPAEVEKAYTKIIKNAKAYKKNASIVGVQVQQMLTPGAAQEVIIGAVTDPSFGKVVAFGLGGVLVEILKDVTFRLAPVTQQEALSMLDGIAAAPILRGVRGESARDQQALAETICSYSNMIVDLADEVSESDANPVLVYEEGRGAKVVDARIILKRKS
jgi:acyl-CoA synthetase (NDP forming)